MASEICTLLGKKIRALRKAKGWRQIDLAEESGLNVIYISDLELGKKEICLNNIQVLAKTFGLAVDDFLKDL